MLRSILIVVAVIAAIVGVVVALNKWAPRLLIAFGGFVIGVFATVAAGWKEWQSSFNQVLCLLTDRMPVRKVEKEEVMQETPVV